jgi:threonine aldolase
MGSLGDEASNGARRVVDFRSDTVTKPTAAMRAAMANAEVDDDILGVDPTMFELQKQVANIMGKEAGLFVPSGTMGDLIAVLVHCEASCRLLLLDFFASCLPRIVPWLLES